MWAFAFDIKQLNRLRPLPPRLRAFADMLADFARLALTQLNNQNTIEASTIAQNAKLVAKTKVVPSASHSFLRSGFMAARFSRRLRFSFPTCSQYPMTNSLKTKTATRDFSLVAGEFVSRR